MIDGRPHGDVQPFVNQADDELLGVDLFLAFNEHKGFDGLFQFLHGVEESLSGVELFNLSFELF